MPVRRDSRKNAAKPVNGIQLLIATLPDDLQDSLYKLPIERRLVIYPGTETD